MRNLIQQLCWQLLHSDLKEIEECFLRSNLNDGDFETYSANNDDIDSEKHCNSLINKLYLIIY